MCSKQGLGTPNDNKKHLQIIPQTSPVDSDNVIRNRISFRNFGNPKKHSIPLVYGVFVRCWCSQPDNGKHRRNWLRATKAEDVSVFSYPFFDRYRLRNGVLEVFSKLRLSSRPRAHSCGIGRFCPNRSDGFQEGKFHYWLFALQSVDFVSKQSLIQNKCYLLSTHFVFWKNAATKIYGTS